MTKAAFNSPRDLVHRTANLMIKKGWDCPIETLMSFTDDMEDWDRDECAAFNTICLASLLECRCSIEIVVRDAPREDVIRVLRRAYKIATPTRIPRRGN